MRMSELLDGVHRLRAREPDELAGAQRGDVAWRAGADPDVSCASSVRSTSTRSTLGSGNGATAPGAKPVASSTSAARAIRAFGRAAGRARSSPVGAPVAGNEHEHGRPSQTKTSDLTIWPSVQPAARAASSAVGVPASNSSIRASAPASRRKAATRSTGSGQLGSRSHGTSEP